MVLGESIHTALTSKNHIVKKQIEELKNLGKIENSNFNGLVELVRQEMPEIQFEKQIRN